MTVLLLWLMCINWNRDTKIKIYKTLADFLIDIPLITCDNRSKIPLSIENAKVDSFLIEDNNTIRILLVE